MKKNNSIYLWRIFFTYVIAFYHLNNAYRDYSGGWYIAVEFFFIVSGYLLCQKVLSDIDKFNPVKYTLKRWLYFIPVYIFSAFLMIVYNAVTNSELINLKWFISLRRYLKDFVLLSTVFSSESANFTGWYLCSLLIGTLVVSSLLKYFNKKTLQFVFPVISIVIYLLLVKYGGCFDIITYFEYFGGEYANYMYLLRGIAGMCLGGFAYIVLKDKTLGEYNRIIETILAVIVLLVSFNHGRKWTDMIWVIMLCMLVILAFKDDVSIAENRIVRFVNDLTIHIYLNHYVVKLFWAQHYCYTFSSVVLYFMAVTMLALLSYSVTKPVCNLVSKIKLLN